MHAMERFFQKVVCSSNKKYSITHMFPLLNFMKIINLSSSLLIIPCGRVETFNIFMGTFLEEFRKQRGDMFN